ncbi:MAG: DUF5658 family protein [Candidatus Hermodarchaeota archaeon]
MENKENITKYSIIIIILILSLYILKILDFFITIIGMSLGAKELNPLGVFESNFLFVFFISFLPITAILILFLVLRKDLYCLKWLGSVSLICNIILISILVSNLNVLKVLL